MNWNYLNWKTTFNYETNRKLEIEILTMILIIIFRYFCCNNEVSFPRSSMTVSCNSNFVSFSINFHQKRFTKFSSQGHKTHIGKLPTAMTWNGPFKDYQNNHWLRPSKDHHDFIIFPSSEKHPRHIVFFSTNFLTT